MASSFLRLLRRLTHRRSNGVAVPIRVARLIRLGDRARSDGDWPRAAIAYRAALARAPRLGHIWVQAGHAAKESGDLDGAAEAYAQAATLAADDPEPHIHLGHVAKLAGRSGESAAHYLEALRRQPDSLAAASELIRTADTDTAAGRTLIAEAIGLVGHDASDAADVPEEVTPRIYLDVTDLLAYFSHARLPTGIQRVQIELTVAALSVPDDAEVAVCCFSEGWRGWRRLPDARLLRIAAASLEDDDRTDPSWRREVVSALLALAAGPRITFAMGSVLLNLGTSWSERNYFLHLRNARESGSPLYIPLIYDLIPMLRPEWFPAALVRDYRAWIGGLFAHADAFVAISETTASDLRRIGASLSRHAVAPDVRVMPLDGDFRRPFRDGSNDDASDDRDRADESFVLMVSTMEPRKNHAGIFAAWLALLSRLPADQVPTLVCVGGRGWMNDRAHALLRRHPALRAKVRLRHGVGDAELAALYRRCLFTVYPSFYEGWGLPITESLCYGKVPAVSATSSMPEAGGAFAVYFDPHDVATMTDALERLIVGTASREAMEARIRRDFVPRPWSTIAERLIADVRALADRPTGTAVPPLDLQGRLSLVADPVDATRSGERLRRGSGWAPPGPDGSGVLSGGAALRLPVGPNRSDGPISLRLVVRRGEPCPVSVVADGCPAFAATLPAGIERWITLSAPGGPIRDLTIVDHGLGEGLRGMGGPEARLIVAEIAFDPPASDAAPA